MPESGRPWGCTPRPASSATAPGISPSPHALSIGPVRGSRTTTESPARWACRAAARPTGPPPATTRSCTGGLRPRLGGRVGSREGGERRVLHPDAYDEQRGVEDGEDQCG